jgi:hypothetical protein
MFNFRPGASRTGHFFDALLTLGAQRSVRPRIVMDFHGAHPQGFCIVDAGVELLAP